MAQWQILVGKTPRSETFDDGLKFAPGDDGFSTEKAKAECARLVKAEKLKADEVTFNYLGTPNWEPPAASLDG